MEILGLFHVGKWVQQPSWVNTVQVIVTFYGNLDRIPCLDSPFCSKSPKTMFKNKGSQKEIRKKSHFIETWTCSCECKKKKKKEKHIVNMKKHFGDIFFSQKKTLLG